MRNSPAPAAPFVKSTWYLLHFCGMPEFFSHPLWRVLRFIYLIRHRVPLLNAHALCAPAPSGIVGLGMPVTPAASANQNDRINNLREKQKEWSIVFSSSHIMTTEQKIGWFQKKPSKEVIAHIHWWRGNGCNQMKRHRLQHPHHLKVSPWELSVTTLRSFTVISLFTICRR